MLSRTGKDPNSILYGIVESQAKADAHLKHFAERLEAFTQDIERLNQRLDTLEQYRTKRTSVFTTQFLELLVGCWVGAALVLTIVIALLHF